MDLTEEIMKGWQEYTEELYKKGLNDPDNHGGVITHLEPDILECKVKWALGGIANNVIVEVMNRFKGLDLVDRVPEELWTEVCHIVQEVVMKTIQKKKIARRQSSCLRKPFN